MSDSVLTLTVHPRVVVNGRSGISVARADIYTLPASYDQGYLYIKLVEVPLISAGVPFTIEEGTYSGGVWTGSGIFYTQHTDVTAPSAGQYQLISLSASAGVISVGYSMSVGGNAGRTIRVSYSGIGSQVSAEDINELSNGLNTATTFNFNGDVMVPGTLTVQGDLDIQGALNKITTDVEELNVKDTNILLNAGGGAITSAGISVDGTGLSTVPAIIWKATPGRWEVAGGFAVQDGLNVAATAIPALTTANVGKVFYDPADDQYKGIIANSGTPKYVVLG